MPVNNREANNAEWMQTISMLANTAQHTSINNVTQLVGVINDTQYDAIGLLKGMTENIDKPILKSFAADMVDVLSAFYMDETALCCLIKNIMMQLGLTLKYEEYREYLDKIKREKGFSQTTFENLIFEMKELDFITYLDYTISVIDIVLVFLELDIKDLIMPSLDFIRDISNAAIGFLLIGMQQIIFTLRDGAIAWIIQEIEKNTADVNWAKCLPYMDFLSVLKKYIHDYGLFDKLMNLFQGFMGDKHRDWMNALKSDRVKNVKLIQFLRWIKSILQQIREAVLSWEFCLFLSDYMDDTRNGDGNNDNPYFNYLADIMANPRGTNDHLRPDFIFGDDNTILNNGGNLGNANSSFGNNDGNGYGSSKGQNSLKVPANDEVRAFLTGYLGVSGDRADQLLGDGALNTGDGTGSGTANSCGSILNPDDLNNMLDRYIKQSRVG